MNIKDQIILVTGAASGMGLATAEHFKQLGARVVGIDLKEGRDIYAADISDAASLEKTMAQIQKGVGTPRVVVHCAGIVDGARAVNKEGVQPLDRFKRVIDINLVGTFNVMRLAASAMMACEPIHADQERGVIIMTASVAAFDGQIGQLAYSASKGGVAAMTLPAAREFGQFGIRVMTIAPGIIQTPMMAGMPEKVYDSLAQQMPFPKRLGLAQEYAQLAQQIIENPYLNGEVIRLDAGLRMSAQ